MTLTEQIDNIYEQMKIQPLSQILQLLLPISLECQDYEGYCILYLWNVTISKTMNFDIQKELLTVLQKENLNNTDMADIVNNADSLYLNMRKISSDKHYPVSIFEMEQTLGRICKAMEFVEVPEGLHPVDLYFKNEASQAQKMELLDQQQLIEKQISILHTFIVSKLIAYRRYTSKLERELAMEKGIKNTKDIFIIHGHNEVALLQLEKMLKEKFNLNPIILKDKPNNGLTIIEKFEQYAQTCSYAIALFTPDDIIENENGDKYLQSRPNVIFELGWFYSHLGRSRTIILEQTSPKSDIFSDLQGIMRIQFNKDVSESYLQIQRELQSIGII